MKTTQSEAKERNSTLYSRRANADSVPSRRSATRCCATTQSHLIERQSSEPNRPAPAGATDRGSRHSTQASTAQISRRPCAGRPHRCERFGARDRFLLARDHVFLPDEYLYSELSRSISSGGLPLVRGNWIFFPSLLQPIFTAPAWLFGSVETGLRRQLVIRIARPSHMLVAELHFVPNRWQAPD